MNERVSVGRTNQAVHQERSEKRIEKLDDKQRSEKRDNVHELVEMVPVRKLCSDQNEKVRGQEMSRIENFRRTHL